MINLNNLDVMDILLIYLFLYILNICYFYCFWIVIVSSVGCSYFRVIYFFIEFINMFCKFMVVFCKFYLSFYIGICDNLCKNGCNRMGYYVSKMVIGNFYLKINVVVFYCKN